VGGSGVTRGEDAGRLDHDVNAKVSPRKIGRVALGQNLQDVTVDANTAVGGGDLVRKNTENRVVLEQMSHGVERSEVVDRHEVDVGA